MMLAAKKEEIGRILRRGARIGSKRRKRVGRNEDAQRRTTKVKAKWYAAVATWQWRSCSSEKTL
jgi:hypothetical protein